jgi:hypothetical protein
LHGALAQGYTGAGEEVDVADEGPGKKPGSDDGFADSADSAHSGGKGREPEAAPLESSDTTGMFAETANTAPEPEQAHDLEAGHVELQELARDPAVDASVDAYSEAMSGVDHPVLAEQLEAPDPYEFRDDGGDSAPDLMEAGSLPTRQDPVAPKPAAKPAAAKPAPAAPKPAAPASSPPKSGPITKPAAPAAKPAAPPKPAAPAPAKPAAAPGTPAPKPAATPAPGAATPKPGAPPKKATGSFALDDLFNRAKQIKDDPKKKP